ncbi:MAG TPA: hypothetical protein VIG74_04410 [Alphaproteobacteria bacterium]
MIPYNPNIQRQCLYFAYCGNYVGGHGNKRRCFKCKKARQKEYNRGYREARKNDANAIH